MAYKALNLSCGHKDRKDDSKWHSKTIGVAIVEDELAAFMKEKNFRISVIPSWLTDTNWTIWPESDKYKDDPGDGKGGRW